MFYAITSKRKGCGRSTIALTSAMVVHKKTNGSTLLVDLGSNNDFCSLMNIKSNASIDNLISAISLQLGDLDLKSNVVLTNGIYILPGTAVKQARYLEKRCNDIVFLLKELESKFNTIILDVDYSLYGDLVDCGLEITPIHILEQNMLNVEGYQKDIQSQIFEGFYVLNSYDETVFPAIDLFEKNFKKNCLIRVNKDGALKSSLNRKSIDMGTIKSSAVFEGISTLADIIAGNLNVIEVEFSGNDAKNKKRKSQNITWFSKLFGKKTKAPSSSVSKTNSGTATKAVKRSRSKPSQNVRGE